MKNDDVVRLVDQGDGFFEVINLSSRDVKLADAYRQYVDQTSDIPGFYVKSFDEWLDS